MSDMKLLKKKLIDWSIEMMRRDRLDDFNQHPLFDSDLNFKRYIRDVICYLRLILPFKEHCQVCQFLRQANAETFIHVFIISIDYCHALLCGLPSKNIAQFQWLQNSAAHIQVTSSHMPVWITQKWKLVRHRNRNRRGWNLMKSELYQTAFTLHWLYTHTNGYG